MARNTYDRGKHFEFGLRLVFSHSGDVRMTRTPPSLAASERAMFLQANLPKALWHTPSLRATIDVKPDMNEPNIMLDLEAAADQMRSALGFDVELRVVPPEKTE